MIGTQENAQARAMEEGESRGTMERVITFAAAILLGGILAIVGVPPFGAVRDGVDATAALLNETFATRPELLGTKTYQGDGLVNFDPALSEAGLTLIQGTLPDGPGMRLLAHDGEELHSWDTDFFRIWPDAAEIFPENRVPQSKFNYIVQGFWPLADGSIVFNFTELGTVKLDKCSNVVWRVPRMNHHSVTPAPDGGFWAPSQISVFDTPAELFPSGYDAQRLYEALDGDYHNFNNTVMKIDDRGQIQKEFSILEAAYEYGLEHAIYAAMAEKVTDPIHLNEIEIVTRQLAEKIDNVDPGDLLVSLRSLNMIAILDQNTGKFKWHQQGPFFRQHDPDITADGKIEIFNNRSRALGRKFHTSQIVSFDPETGKSELLYPQTENSSFYSSIMGAHQRLDNGNRLIVESTAGRVFEVTPGGDVVWDYRLAYDDQYASLISYAMRLPNDYFEGDWTCPSKAN